MNNENSMNESSEFKRGLNRRDVLKGVAAVSLGLVIGAYQCHYGPGEQSRYHVG
jgi:hypothetical protein